VCLSHKRARDADAYQPGKSKKEGTHLKSGKRGARTGGGMERSNHVNERTHTSATQKQPRLPKHMKRQAHVRACLEAAPLFPKN
jgi:hypothetical protein